MQIAKNDQEPYVRASALKCLSKMVMINIIWDNDLNNQDLMVSILFFTFRFCLLISIHLSFMLFSSRTMYFMFCLMKVKV